MISSEPSICGSEPATDTPGTRPCGFFVSVRPEIGKDLLKLSVIQLDTIFDSALTCHRAGQLDQAADLYLRILAIDRHHAQASNNLGAIFMSHARFDEAIGCFQNAVKVNVEFLEAHLNLAKALQKLGRYGEAASSLSRALALEPNYIPAYLDLSFLCYQQGDTNSAISCCKKALELDPACADAFNNLGNAIAAQGDFTAALEAYDQALQISPDRADVRFNLANTLKSCGQLPAAIENYQRALTLKPDYIEAHWNLSHALLLSGNFEDGWREYEWRFELPVQENIYPYRHGVPRWDGSPFKGKRLLVHDEQGFGDTLQFLRYLPMVKALGGTVFFEVRQQLLKLISSAAGFDELMARSTDGHPPLAFDLCMPLMSLPAAFNTTPANIPTPIPYLAADTELTRQWAQKLKPISGFKVGICWQGNPAHQADRRRSVPLKYFAPLAAVPGTQLISLQKKHGLDQLADLSPGVSVIDFGCELDEDNGVFMDTAAIMKNLDLVIASDTAIPHLAGAMGVPVWLVLPAVPEWRWLMERNDSPWYPTMRLFRQPTPGDWTTAFDQIAAALNRLVGKRHSRGLRKHP